jgi:GTPase SAR1 family protein
MPQPKNLKFLEIAKTHLGRAVNERGELTEHILDIQDGQISEEDIETVCTLYQTNDLASIRKISESTFKLAIEPSVSWISKLFKGMNVSIHKKHNESNEESYSYTVFEVYKRVRYRLTSGDLSKKPGINSEQLEDGYVSSGFVLFGFRLIVTAKLKRMEHLNDRGVEFGIDILEGTIKSTFSSSSKDSVSRNQVMFQFSLEAIGNFHLPEVIFGASEFSIKDQMKTLKMALEIAEPEGAAFFPEVVSAYRSIEDYDRKYEGIYGHIEKIEQQLDQGDIRQEAEGLKLKLAQIKKDIKSHLRCLACFSNSPPKVDDKEPKFYENIKKLFELIQACNSLVFEGFVCLKTKTDKRTYYIINDFGSIEYGSQIKVVFFYLEKKNILHDRVSFTLRTDRYKYLALNKGPGEKKVYLDRSPENAEEWFLKKQEGCNNLLITFGAEKPCYAIEKPNDLEQNFVKYCDISKKNLARIVIEQPEVKLVFLEASRYLQSLVPQELTLETIAIKKLGSETVLQNNPAIAMSDKQKQDAALLRERLPYLTKAIAQRLSMVLGLTGAGKSTLIAALLGASFKKENTGIVAIPKGNVRYPKTASGDSVTRYPDIYHYGEEALCDCPGFYATQGKQEDLLNAFAMQLVVGVSKAIKSIIIVLDIADIQSSRGQNLKQLFDCLSCLIATDEKTLPTLKRNVFFVINLKKGLMNDDVKLDISFAKESYRREIETKKYELTKLAESMKVLCGKVGLTGEVDTDIPGLTELQSSLDDYLKEINSMDGKSKSVKDRFSEFFSPLIEFFRSQDQDKETAKLSVDSKISMVRELVENKPTLDALQEKFDQVSSAYKLFNLMDMEGFSNVGFWNAYEYHDGAMKFSEKRNADFVCLVWAWIRELESYHIDKSFFPFNQLRYGADSYFRNILSLDIFPKQGRITFLQEQAEYLASKLTVCEERRNLLDEHTIPDLTAQVAAQLVAKKAERRKVYEKLEALKKETNIIECLQSHKQEWKVFHLLSQIADKGRLSETFKFPSDGSDPRIAFIKVEQDFSADRLEYIPTKDGSAPIFDEPRLVGGQIQFFTSFTATYRTRGIGRSIEAGQLRLYIKSSKGESLYYQHQIHALYNKIDRLNEEIKELDKKVIAYKRIANPSFIARLKQYIYIEFLQRGIVLFDMRNPVESELEKKRGELNSQLNEQIEGIKKLQEDLARELQKSKPIFSEDFILWSRINLIMLAMKRNIDELGGLNGAAREVKEELFNYPNIEGFVASCQAVYGFEPPSFYRDEDHSDVSASTLSAESAPLSRDREARGFSSVHVTQAACQDAPFKIPESMQEQIDELVIDNGYQFTIQPPVLSKVRGSLFCGVTVTCVPPERCRKSIVKREIEKLIHSVGEVAHEVSAEIEYNDQARSLTIHHATSLTAESIFNELKRCRNHVVTQLRGMQEILAEDDSAFECRVS